jgi:hypothetical protein
LETFEALRLVLVVAFFFEDDTGLRLTVFFGLAAGLLLAPDFIGFAFFGVTVFFVVFFLVVACFAIVI